MARYPECRLLAIIGSGETSPTMVTVHRDLVSRLGLTSPQAILLATPYAFQENAADVSTRAQRYFAESVGLQVRIAAGTSPHADPGMAPPLTGEDDQDEGRQAADIRTADWVFAGPGSPSYALAHWQAGPVAAGLRDRVPGRPRDNRAGLGGRRHRGTVHRAGLRGLQGGRVHRAGCPGLTCSGRSA